MTGAVTSLKKSLQFNSENIAARNLLGLVYYGRGEVGEALVEWILSKNLRPKDNIANYYIQKIQKSPADLDTINQAITQIQPESGLLRAGRRRYGYHPVKAGSSSISGIPEEHISFWHYCICTLSSTAGQDMCLEGSTQVGYDERDHAPLYA